MPSSAHTNFVSTKVVSHVLHSGHIQPGSHVINIMSHIQTVLLIFSGLLKEKKVAFCAMQMNLQILEICLRWVIHHNDI